ncbi:MAG TPA: nickel insertion protein [archaeon]|nr:nickel insertion protein [archaeon]
MKAKKSELVVLETNLDDIDGEVLGNMFSALMPPALDVNIIPATMKKNRPGHIVRVICSKENSEKLAEKLMEETGTTGVREILCDRWFFQETKVEKRKVNINGKEFDINFKISEHNEKPEFEDLKKLSENLKMPLRKMRKLTKPL